ncbi:19900_t:CDS:2, partial [Dentiscutata erythropus]
ILSANDDSDSSFLEDFCQTTDSIINDIANILESLVIMKLVKIFKMDDPINTDLEDTDNSLEISIVSADIATASLKTMLTFLL